jgi:hypothetical protein
MDSALRALSFARDGCSGEAPAGIVAMLVGPTSAAEAAADFSNDRLVSTFCFLGFDRGATNFSMVQSFSPSSTGYRKMLVGLISPWIGQLASSTG